MKRKGIDFENISDEKALQYLTEKNYYMKLTAYRKNYQKYQDGNKKGKYKGLKFKYLVELSEIDMHLRYSILKMCLDIEHHIKIKLLYLIESNDKENGYTIVKEYFKKYPNSDFSGRLNRTRSTSYAHDLINKYNPNFPIWVLVELISFGELLKFCSLYEELYGKKVYERKILNNIRDIRNAAAHNNCLINDLGSKYKSGGNYSIAKINDFLVSIDGISKNTRTKKMKNKTIECFINLIYGYSEIVKNRSLKKKRIEELVILFRTKIARHKEYFISNDLICTSYKFVYLCLLQISKYTN